MLFALRNYGYSFDMCGLMGPKFFKQDGTSSFKIRLTVESGQGASFRTDIGRNTAAYR